MGKVTVVGGKVGMEVPIADLLAENIAVGSSVYLKENGSKVEYIVVNKGIPSNSSLYDSSCDGLWLMRKKLYCPNQAIWNSGTNNTYANSYMDTELNGTFLNRFDATTKAIIKQVKIPYVNGYGKTGSIASGANGLSRKIFSISVQEMNLGTHSPSARVDGACLTYFEGTANPDSKRIGYIEDNNSAGQYWLRTPHHNTTTTGLLISANGGLNSQQTGLGFMYRPALILPKTALFDKKTLVLKGVK